MPEKINDDYNPDKKLCVFPTGSEPQYESFQSIFARIMGATYPIQKNINKFNAYELLCLKYDIKLMNEKPKKSDFKKHERIIYFKNPKSGSTHYIAYLNGKKLDPYDYFQAKGTQGFCQMFSFFLVIDDTHLFEKVDQTKKINEENFNKLTKNTQNCFTKSLEIIKGNKDVLELFKTEFNYIKDFEADYYGISKAKSMSFNKYISDFVKINNNLTSVKHYIYDLPLKGWRKSAPKEILWESYM